MSEKKPFDMKTLAVVLLVGVVFFGWQKYLETKYPDFYTRSAEESKTAHDTEATPEASANKEAAGLAAAPTRSVELARPADTSIQTFPVTTHLWSGQLSSVGMGFEEVKSLTYKNHQGEDIYFSKDLPLFQVVDVSTNKPVHFNVTQEGNTFTGTATLEDGTELVRSLSINTEEGQVAANTRFIKKGSGFKGIAIVVGESVQESEGGAFFMPSFDWQEVVARSAGELDHHKFSADLQSTLNSVDLMAVSSQYFTAGLVDKTALLGTLKIETDNLKRTFAKLQYELPAVGDLPTIESKIYIGPKAYDLLSNVDPALTQVINFGFFSTIASWLLLLLRFLNQYAPNWGASIILLTIVVRMIVLPFSILSFKSMKKMQKIQPKLQALRAKYKEDPATLNKETMSLMKTEKVNPLGGCLPMLLQMPVFFALYQVLGQSVELYQAPFIFWIQDLSLKDPYYVLPVLMGATLFIQHKITPTTMDPQQAKILAWMPVIFTVFTVGLPAGLTLYIFISTLFGVVQQQLFMMDRKQEVTT